MAELPKRERSRHLDVLPVDPTDEQLARDFSLTKADLAEVRRCRGDANRLRFALQFLVLRFHGRFLDDVGSVPIRIVNHVGRQLDLPPVLSVQPSDRAATGSGHAQRIRAHLGYRPFNASAQRRLERWLGDQPGDVLAATDLSLRAADALRVWKTEIPAASTLDRVVTAVASHAEEETFQQVSGRLSPKLVSAIEELLGATTGKRSPLFWLKEYPPSPTPATIQTFIERFRRLDGLGAAEIDLRGIGAERIAALADLVERHDAGDLKRFSPAKRHALVACFLHETHKTLLDYVIEMHHVFVTGMNRRAHNSFAQEHQDAKRREKGDLTTVLETIELLIQAAARPTTLVGELCRDVDVPEVCTAVKSCRARQRLEERGYVDKLLSRHHILKRYLPTFLALPFEGKEGMEDLLTAIDLARKLHTGGLKELPAFPPVSLVQASWRDALAREDGMPDQRLWEIALAFAVQDALRSGDLYLAKSRHHVSFWNLVYDADKWEKERQQAYIELGFATMAQSTEGPRSIRSNISHAGTCGRRHSRPPTACSSTTTTVCR